MGKNLKEGVEKGVIKTISDNTLEEDLGTLKEGIGSEPEKPTFAASLYGEPRGVVNSSGHPLRKTGAIRQIDHGDVTLATQLLNQNSTTMQNPFSPTSVNTPHEHYTRTSKTLLDPAVTTTRNLKKAPKEKKIPTPKPKHKTTRQVTTKF